MGANVRSCTRCGARLASDNTETLCRPCLRAARSAQDNPPDVPPEFWDNEGLRDALTKERHIGHAVRSYRKHPFHGRRAIPQEVAANWLGISQAQLARIERGRAISDLDRLIQWARILSIPQELLWFTLPENTPDERGEVKRRQFLVATASLPAISKTATSAKSVERREAPLPSNGADLQEIELLRQEMSDSLSRSTMNDADIDDWERIAIRYARATRGRSATVLLRDISHDLRELDRMIGRQRSVPSMRRLTRVSAQMSGLMCLAFCLLDDRSSFRAWARTAALAGNAAGDNETLSWIYAQEAYGHYYSGDMVEAIDVAHRACEVVRTPCVGSALASALEARALAITGKSAETRIALGRAEETLSHLEGDALIPSAFGYNEASFRFHEGNAYTHLGDVDSAMRAQDRALELCAPDNYADWAMTRFDRAQCLIHGGDPTVGLEYATETIESLRGAQRKGIVTLRGKEILKSLPSGGRPLVAAHDFREILNSCATDSEVNS